VLLLAKALRGVGIGVGAGFGELPPPVLLASTTGIKHGKKKKKT